MENVAFFLHILGLTRAGVVLVAIGTVLAGVFGLWLVHVGKWGYGTGWVDASIVLLVAVIGLGGVGGRRPKEARLLASRLAEQDVSSDSELRALLDDRVSCAENDGSMLLVLVIIALMVLKP
ncbi:MAG TPA: hypothetical protein VMU39_11845 [Solirubrobacteraceae bacterium]|nr:hypothetical protein [Solirubrobacteraceae bacterium]